MALIECSECNAQISDQAQSCPHCGNQLRPSEDEERERLRRTQGAKANRRAGIGCLVVIVAGIAALMFPAPAEGIPGPVFFIAVFTLIFAVPLTAWFVVRALSYSLRNWWRT